jgi:hypothetical protein
MKVIPEGSQMLRLESFTVTYQISKIHHRGKTAIKAMRRRKWRHRAIFHSNGLIQMIHRDHWYDFDGSYVKYLYDSISSIHDTGRDSCLAILLVDNSMCKFDRKSYWMALKPAYDDNGRHFFYREGIIVICGRLKWQMYRENALRNRIWLI